MTQIRKTVPACADLSWIDRLPEIGATYLRHKAEIEQRRAFAAELRARAALYEARADDGAATLVGDILSSGEYSPGEIADAGGPVLAGLAREAVAREPVDA